MDITIEYVILVPLLFVQIIVFPFVAATITSNWQESQRVTTLQESADHISSTIQQLYLNTNREEILTSNITHVLNIPATIDSYPYTAVGTLSTPSDPESTRILTTTLTMEDGNSVKSVAVMGHNVIWIEDSILDSDSTNVSIFIQKLSNGTMIFAFGG